MTDTTPAAPALPASEPEPQAACRNCGRPLLGPHCYACGQPVKGLVRPLGNLLGDLMDSVFEVDSRIFRTLPPLFARPGFLTTEYFAGRQVRYVTPVRLLFFMAVIAFFFAQLAVDFGPDAIQVDARNANDGIASATTVADVERLRDERLAELAAAKASMQGSPAELGLAGIEAGEAAVRKASESRIRQLQEAQARGEPPPGPAEDSLDFEFNGKRWDARANPITTPLPDFVDRWLNAQLARGNENISRLKQDPAAFKDAVLGVVPTVLFVLVPIFALMLKLAYVFKRRLYMEHVVVALHSHAFLCLDLLLVFVLNALEDALPGPGTLTSLLDILEGLLLLWMPVYLLVMQKRVYAQGWPMTLLKYMVIGTCYSVLLAFGILVALAIGLVAM